jgi:CO dehydrogenase maturation factor
MHATVRSVIEAASDAVEDVCILDTEASPEHLSRGTAQYAETMLIVVEPYYKSLETGRRMAVLGRDLGLPKVELVANKVRDERELQAVEEFAGRHGIDVAGVVPFDETFPESERAQQAPLDFAPEGPAVVAITEIGRELARDGRA